MREKNSKSKFKLLVAVIIFGYGLLSLTNSIFGGILLIVGSLLLFPKLKDLAIDAHDRITNRNLLVFSIVSIVLGGVSVSIGKYHKERMLMKKNPEIALGIEKDKENRKIHTANTKLKNDLLTLCDVTIKKQLKNPESYDRDYSAVEFTNINDNLLIKYDYKAENSFGAIVPSSVECSLDKNMQFNIKYGN